MDVPYPAPQSRTKQRLSSARMESPGSFCNWVLHQFGGPWKLPPKAPEGLTGPPVYFPLKGIHRAPWFGNYDIRSPDPE